MDTAYPTTTLLVKLSYICYHVSRLQGKRQCVLFSGETRGRLPPAVSPEHAHFLFGGDFPGVLAFHQAQPILSFPGENPGTGRLPVFAERSGGAALSGPRHSDVA